MPYVKYIDFCITIYMKKYTVCIISILVLCFTSCKAKHDLAYFDDINNLSEGVLSTVKHTNVIEPENELIITVNSKVPEASVQFNLPYTNTVPSGTKNTSTPPQQQTYVVDESGNIEFPVLGKIHVAGMTTYQLKDYLVSQIDKYVKDPMVNVRLMGYSISVLGEVNRPGTVTTHDDRFSILNALAEAGDLTDYGKRDNILVMRRAENGDIQYARLNLHNSNITQSPYFWLQNNDVVVVEPNGVKQDNSKYNQYSGYKLTVVSTVVSTASIIASLVIALTVK